MGHQTSLGAGLAHGGGASYREPLAMQLPHCTPATRADQPPGGSSPFAALSQKWLGSSLAGGSACAGGTPSMGSPASSVVAVQLRTTTHPLGWDGGSLHDLQLQTDNLKPFRSPERTAEARLVGGAVGCVQSVTGPGTNPQDAAKSRNSDATCKAHRLPGPAATTGAFEAGTTAATARVTTAHLLRTTRCPEGRRY